MAEWRPRNRDKARSPRPGGKRWCVVCDYAMVGDGERCPVCRKRILPFRGRRNEYINMREVA